MASSSNSTANSSKSPSKTLSTNSPNNKNTSKQISPQSNKKSITRSISWIDSTWTNSNILKNFAVPKSLGFLTSKTITRILSMWVPLSWMCRLSIIILRLWSWRKFRIIAKELLSWSWRILHRRLSCRIRWILRRNFILIVRLWGNLEGRFRMFQPTL